MKNTLKQIMEHYNHTASEFAENVGIQRSSISHFLSGRNNPSLDVIRKILTAYPDINSDWLILGEGDMLLTPLNNKTEVLSTSKSEVTQVAEPSPQQPHLFDQMVKEEPQAPYYTQKELIAKKEAEENAINRVYKSQNNDIERVIIFYTDGTFKEYKSQKST